MMLRMETVVINDKAYIRTWSDVGRMIERDGILYEEALDPAEMGRTYAETDVEIAQDAEADIQGQKVARSEFWVKA